MENPHPDSILVQERQLGPYPMERLKRVAQPTVRITDSIQRFDEREHGFSRARRGDFGPNFAQMGTIGGYALANTMKNMTELLVSAVDGEVSPEKEPIWDDPQVLSRHIKIVGYFLRADIVGICKLPQWAVYSHDLRGNPVELNHQNAIVLLVDQDYRTISGSTGYDSISGSQSLRSYSATAWMACLLAGYIRRLGYPARAHHASNYQVVVPPLLLLSGIGEMCRMGIVLNPFLGVRFKAAVVTTDLPLAPDMPVDFGLREFCRKCMRCAAECPSRAVPTGDTVVYNGYENWKIDVERCTKFRSSNPHGSGCGRCIKACPFNKPEGRIHDVARWMIQHTPFVDGLLIKLDDMLGYGKQDLKNKWWYDMAKNGTRDRSPQCIGEH